MIEIAIILALVALLGWEHYQNRLERNRLIDTIISKNATEAANLRYMEKIPKPSKSIAPDLIPLDEVPDEAFEKLLHRQLEEDQEPNNE